MEGLKNEAPAITSAPGADLAMEIHAFLGSKTMRVTGAEARRAENEFRLRQAQPSSNNASHRFVITCI